MKIKTSLISSIDSKSDCFPYNNKNQRWFDDEFAYQIRKRGEEYYKNNHVKRCSKTSEGYIAIVKGRYDDYIVRIYSNNYGLLEMGCSCPYDDNCKHEYAVLLAIEEGLFNELDLKVEIPAQIYSIQDIISKIPAEKLKEYLLNSGSDAIVFEVEAFESAFFDYLPRQLENYYYNSLYNSYILKMDFIELLSKYLLLVKKHVEKEVYDVAFDIIKSIIKVYIDLKIEDMHDIIPNFYPSLGMYLRIIYRKCNVTLQTVINKWIKDLKAKEYYNNIYLEDIIITIK